MTSTQPDNRGHRLKLAGELTELHHGREVEVDGLTGTLVGLLPCDGDVTLALIVGGSRAWKTVSADEPVDVAGRGAA